MKYMRYIGIDYGKKRVGIALSDEGNSFALPKVVLENGPDLVSEIKKLCDEHKVTDIIIGDSKNFKGEPNAIMADINTFKATLEGELKLPIHMEPEFLTSAEAERIQGKNESHDASAAALILKSFLDKKAINAKPAAKPLISYDDFTKVEIKAGKILHAERVPATDKLLRLEVDLGEVAPRQIVSGISVYFPEPKELVGTVCMFVTNLEPRKIKGLESQGMILAVGDGETFSLLSPNDTVPPGSSAR